MGRNPAGISRQGWDAERDAGVSRRGGDYAGAVEKGEAGSGGAGEPGFHGGGVDQAGLLELESSLAKTAKLGMPRTL